ncbi:MAG: choice-of-anchor B family protein, partial [Bacteroidota bacterium]
LFLISSLSAQTQPSLNLDYVSDYQYTEPLSDVWGYVDQATGTEYAIVGLQNGTSVISLADPENPVEVGYYEGPSSTWRDIKTYGTFAYVTNETAQGLAVIDLSDLPNGISGFDWTPDLGGQGGLNSCHNIYIDEDTGVAFLAGCNLNSGGLILVDVKTNPGQPEFISFAPNTYSHDVYTRGNLMYSSEINIGRLAIYDITDPQNISLVNTQFTPSLFTHNAWLSDDGNVVYTTDERGSAPVASYDISNLNDIELLDEYRPYATLGEGVIPHNVHVWKDFLIVSYYTDGCIIIDANRPENLVEVGNFDSFIPASTGFEGVWGAYPFLPSELVLASDIGNGLFVLRPNYVRACYLEGTIRDASNGNTLAAAQVVVDDTDIFELSSAAGDYKTGSPTAGTYTARVFVPGYEEGIQEVELENGMVTIADFELNPLPSFSMGGTVLDKDTGEPVDSAIVHIANNLFEYDVVTSEEGTFSFPIFYEGEYDVVVGKWGYRTNVLLPQNFNESFNDITIEIEEGLEDIFSLDLGWEVQNNTFQGGWDRGEPIGVFVSQAGGFITPEMDVEEDDGNDCYVTGNIDDVFNGVLIGGSSTLRSPKFDLSTYSDPYLSYYTWYLNISTSGAGVGDDPFFVILNNGFDEQFVEIIEYDPANALAWNYSEIRVRDFMEPTANMQIRFLANSPDFEHAIESAVDYFQAWDAGPVSTDQVDPLAAKLSVAPNPSTSAFELNYQLEAAEDAQLVVYNVIGQQILQIELDDLQGTVRFGGTFKEGVYMVQLQDGQRVTKTLKVIKQ